MGLRWAWRFRRRETIDYTPNVGMTRDEARAALAAWVQPEASAPLSSVFAPHYGLFGLWVTRSVSSLPTLVPGSTGDAVGYMQGILFWKANQPCRPPAAGGFGFGPTTANCVRSFKAFFGVPNATSATVDANTWNAIQFCAQHLPNRTL